MTSAALVSLGLVLLAPCGSSSFTAGDSESRDLGSTDPAPDADPPPPAVCDDGGEVVQLVLGRVRFGRAVGGRVPGFDLDGDDSMGAGRSGCGQLDGTGFDGQPGIDNAMADLWDELSAEAGWDVEAMYAASYTNGNYAIGLRLGGVDSLENDECVSVGVQWMFSRESPELAGEDGYADGQEWVQFDLYEGGRGRIRDGVLDVYPGDETFRSDVLLSDRELSGASGFTGSQPRIRLVMGEGAVIAARLEASQLASWWTDVGGSNGERFFGSRADLNGSGSCSALSAVLMTGPEATASRERDRL